jgi:neutral ceramidase
MTMSSGFRAGFGRASITAYDPSLCMLGWADHRNKPRAVAEPLYARALVVEERSTQKRVAYVCCELGMISESIRRHTLARLAGLTTGLGEHEVMLTATHTHSGPSGYSTYLFFALTAPGFSQPVHDAIVDGIVHAILQAVESLAPARLFVHREQLPVSEAIAFNRAVAVYNRNRDTSPLDLEHRDEAVDRQMTVLRVDRADGSAMGLVSWFGLHGTCVHKDNVLIHPDHKGEAARRLEVEQAEAANPDYVAIFAQTAAGDVTPNIRRSATRGFAIGRYDDDFESAAHVGEVQARHAKAIAAAAPVAGVPVLAGLDAAVRYFDFFAAPVDPDYAWGQAGLRTAPPVVGWSFTAGTEEGPGPFHGMQSLGVPLQRLRRAGARALGTWTEDAELHGDKYPFWELGRGREGRILGLFAADSAILDLVRLPHFEFYRRAVQASAADHLPWVPRYLPAQLLELGPLVIAGLPLEPTVVSGRRLERSIARALGGAAGHVVINGYANAHASYLTTPEEYDAQEYEGACTMFGRWSLPAWSTAFDELAAAMRTEPRPLSLGSPPPTQSLADCLPHSSPRNVVNRTRDPMQSTDLPSRIEHFYQDLAHERDASLDRMDELFCHDVRFCDPFRETTGLAALRRLFERWLAQYPSIDFRGIHRVGSPEAFTLTYEMIMKMRVGPAFVTPMASVCVARDGKVAELTDYYDFASALVSPIRLAGRLYRGVVNRLFL